MNFLRRLFGKTEDGPARREPGSGDTLEQSYRDTIGALAEEERDVNDVLSNVNSKLKTSGDAEPSVNIWDMDDKKSSGPAPDAPSTEAAAAAARSPARARRTKTRLIGFDKSDGDVVDIFNDVPKASPAPPQQNAKFPVGWIVVTEGPGRGESFALFAGMSQIGRGEDQAVQLDFGDNSISRTNHAAIVYDSDSQEYLLGHGGKSNIVRLNDKPLISNEALKTGDIVRIGETVLRFVALCNEEFNWSEEEADEEDDEDVAIA